MVAINQVLRGLHESRRDSISVVFTLDPGYVYLRSLAYHDAADETLLAAEIL